MWVLVGRSEKWACNLFKVPNVEDPIKCIIETTKNENVRDGLSENNHYKVIRRFYKWQEVLDWYAATEKGPVWCYYYDHDTYECTMKDVDSHPGYELEWEDAPKVKTTFKPKLKLDHPGWGIF